MLSFFSGESVVSRRQTRPTKHYQKIQKSIALEDPYYKVSRINKNTICIKNLANKNTHIQ